MHKLLPFRQYDENDVIGLFNLDVSSLKGSKYTALSPDDITFSKGGNWSGTAVVNNSSTKLTLGGDEPTRTYDDYLGKIGGSNQGEYALKQGSFYPTAAHDVTVAAADAQILGITLRATMAWDENDEKLLYYPVKKDEFQAVLPGETVPVATRGFFTITVGLAASGAGIVDATELGGASAIVPGANLQAAADGKLGIAGVGKAVVGRVLATGKNAGKNVALVKIG